MANGNISRNAIIKKKKKKVENTKLKGRETFDLAGAFFFPKLFYFH